MAENQGEKDQDQVLSSKNMIKDCIKPACILALIPTHFTVKRGCSEP